MGKSSVWRQFVFLVSRKAVTFCSVNTTFRERPEKKNLFLKMVFNHFFLHRPTPILKCSTPLVSNWALPVVEIHPFAQNGERSQPAPSHCQKIIRVVLWHQPIIWQTWRTVGQKLASYPISAYLIETLGVQTLLELDQKISTFVLLIGYLRHLLLFFDPNFYGKHLRFLKNAGLIIKIPIMQNLFFRS